MVGSTWFCSHVTRAAVLAPVTVSLQTTRGGRDGYRISNGIVDIVVVPSIGRIMRFGAVGKRNLLYESTASFKEARSSDLWKNWGGDKVWPAPQALWGWPPEHEYDGSSWNAEPFSNGIRMNTRNPSTKLGIRFQRTIVLEAGATSVKIKNTLYNVSGRTQRLAVWEVCQVDDPIECDMPLFYTPNNLRGWHPFGKEDVEANIDSDGKVLKITRDPKGAHKFGSASPDEFVSALFPDFRLSLRAKYVARGEYPDEGSAEQIFTSANPSAYDELELTGPLVDLKPGESTHLTVTMSLKANR